MTSTSFRIGPYAIANRALVAPMAGVTDRPFRQLCKRLGAAYAVSEMASSNPLLRDSVKTERRTNHEGESEPRAVQIVGADPRTMADAARHNVARGAQIIDINMGCPARKVCNVAAGSALMAQEALAVAIVDAVARAVDVPVTVKLRTGPDLRQRNAVRLARAFESAGARMLAVHGRTRACAFRGSAEYETIAEVKAAVRVPVVANGDVDSPRKAAEVLRSTGADAVMIGRAAQGRPWIFRQVAHYLDSGEMLARPDDAILHAALREHLLDHYAFHGEQRGVRSARKHVGWYLRARDGIGATRDRTHAGHDGTSAARESAAARFLAWFHTIETARGQLDAIDRWFAGDAQWPQRDGAANDTLFRRSDAA